MKRIIEIKALATIVAIVSVLASACSHEAIPSGGDGEYLSFVASLDDSSIDGNTTRTYLDGTQVKWELNDKLSLWYGTINTSMTRADYFVGAVGTDARTATLNGFAKESDDYMAVYPRSAAKDCSKKGKLTIEFPMKQDLRIGSFGSDANVSVAYSNTTDLTFKNVGGLLAFKIAATGGHTIKKIRLTGTAAMAGEVEIKQATIADGNPTIDAINESINFLTLDCGEGIEDPGKDMGTTEFYTEEPGTWGDTKAGIYSGSNVYYLAALPGSHTSFALTFVDSDGKTAVAKSSYSYSINRNSNALIANISLSDDNFKKDKEIYINEIFCHEDKIELYNAEKKDVDLTGYYFTKDDEKYWAIPAGTTIPSKGYLVITAGQTDCTLGPTWGISGDKGFELKLSNGKKVDKIDNTGDGKLIVGETETMGRRTNGADEWVVFSAGTIYEEGTCDGDNSKGTVKVDDPHTVVLNEIDASSKTIELYNTGTETVNLNGWTILKDEDVVWTGTSGDVIAAGVYLVLYSSKNKDNPIGAPVFSGGISGKKNLQVALRNASAEIKDTFTRGEKSIGWGEVTLPEHIEWSFSRVPNGNGEWKYAMPTKGAENGPKTGIIEQFPAADGVVVLNELNGNSKFIELYNTSTDYKISLEEVTIYKDGGTTPIWTGAQGVSIAPGGYLLLYSEDVKGSHPEHDSKLIFSSGLSPKKTLKIEMKAADGSTSMDVFTRGSEPWGTTISSRAESFGRTPDGTGDWKLIDATPGAANGASKGDIPQN